MALGAQSPLHESTDRSKAILNRSVELICHRALLPGEKSPWRMAEVCVQTGFVLNHTFTSSSESFEGKFPRLGLHLIGLAIYCSVTQLQVWKCKAVSILAPA